MLGRACMKCRSLSGGASTVTTARSDASSRTRAAVLALVATTSSWAAWVASEVKQTASNGTNPTIQWDDKAGSGNKWNVPVGFSAAKMTKLGNMPLRIEFGVEYSVVNEDDYGEVARFKFNFIPLVSRPIKKAIFGE